MKTLATGASGRDMAARGASQPIRGYGDFLHYHLLRSGKIDAVDRNDVNILDIAACVAIVSEAGAVSRISTVRHHPSIHFRAGHQRAHACPILAALS